MPVIGIIDDREDIRVTLKRKLDLSLRKQNLPWITIDMSPFEKMSDYISWITENEVSVLILDERLQEVGQGAEKVDYNGSKLIEFIRKSFPEFPVFAITTFPNDPDLQARFPLFDDILGRNDFFAKADEYTVRFTRAGQQFLNVFNSQLARISELSRKIAVGEATEAEKNELNGLQELLNIPFTTLIYDNREEWLHSYEKKLIELDEIKNQIKSFIQNKGK